jgi:hypothetical protein
VAAAPYWTEMVAAVHADRAARGVTLVDEGIDRMLHMLSPLVRELWAPKSLDGGLNDGARAMQLLASGGSSRQS